VCNVVEDSVIEDDTVGISELGSEEN